MATQTASRPSSTTVLSTGNAASNIGRPPPTLASGKEGLSSGTTVNQPTSASQGGPVLVAVPSSSSATTTAVEPPKKSAADLEKERVNAILLSSLLSSPSQGPTIAPVAVKKSYTGTIFLVIKIFVFIAIIALIIWLAYKFVQWLRGPSGWIKYFFGLPGILSLIKDSR